MLAVVNSALLSFATLVRRLPREAPATDKRDPNSVPACNRIKSDAGSELREARPVTRRTTR